MLCKVKFYIVLSFLSHMILIGVRYSKGHFHLYVIRCSVGWAKNAGFFVQFRILQMLCEILLIHRTKWILPKFQLIWTFFCLGTPRLKVVIFNNFFFLLFNKLFTGYRSYKNNTNVIKEGESLWNNTDNFVCIYDYVPK